MSTCRVRDSLELPGYVRGWAVSFMVHATAVIFGIVLASDLRLAPQPEVFKWDVAVLDPPKPVPKDQPTPTETKPRTAQTPARPTPTKSRPVEREPVVQTVQTVERVIRHQEAREVQATQAVTQEVPLQEVAPQPLTAEAQPVETAAHPVQAAAQPVVSAVTHVSARAAETYVAKPEALVGASQALSREPIVTAAVPHSVQGTPGVVPRPGAHASQTPAAPVEAAIKPVPPAPVEAVHRPPAATTAKGLPPVAERQVSSENHMTRRSVGARPDFGWLTDVLWKRIEQRKGYPNIARMNRWEGKVTLRITLRQDGQAVALVDLGIEESSGYTVLDSHAVEVVRKAFPLQLNQALGQPQVLVHLPIAFKMDQ